MVLRATFACGCESCFALFESPFVCMACVMIFMCACKKPSNCHPACFVSYLFSAGWPCMCDKTTMQGDEQMSCKNTPLCRYEAKAIGAGSEGAQTNLQVRIFSFTSFSSVFRLKSCLLVFVYMYTHTQYLYSCTAHQPGGSSHDTRPMFFCKKTMLAPRACIKYFVSSITLPARCLFLTTYCGAFRNICIPHARIMLPNVPNLG